MMLMLVAAVALMISGRWFIVGRWLGGRLDRSEPAHAQAVVGLLFFAAVAVIPLIILSGEPPFLRYIRHGGSADVGPVRTEAGQVLDNVYQIAWFVLFALVAVGVPVARSFGSAMKRLGVLPFRWRVLPLLVGVI